MTSAEGDNFLGSFYNFYFTPRFIALLLFKMIVLSVRLIFTAFLAVVESRLDSSSETVSPRSTASSAGLITATNETTVLNATLDAPAIVTFDYGHAVEGIPTFEVVSVEGDTSIFEITYAESLAALSIYMVR